MTYIAAKFDRLVTLVHIVARFSVMIQSLVEEFVFFVAVVGGIHCHVSVQAKGLKFRELL